MSSISMSNGDGSSKSSRRPDSMRCQALGVAGVRDLGAGGAKGHVSDISVTYAPSHTATSTQSERLRATKIISFQAEPDKLVDIIAAKQIRC